MTDTPAEDAEATEDQTPDPPAVVTPPPADALALLGFDPTRVQAVVVTPTAVVAIAIDYPEPYVAPEPDTTPEEAP